MVTMQQQSSQQPKIVTLQDFIAELGRDDVATANLVGYFDVLIEMDLELKEQERIDENERRKQTSDSWYGSSLVQRVPTTRRNADNLERWIKRDWTDC